MALTTKGDKILRAMKKYYKDDERAEEIFYEMQKKERFLVQKKSIMNLVSGFLVI